MEKTDGLPSQDTTGIRTHEDDARHVLPGHTAPSNRVLSAETAPSIEKDTIISSPTPVVPSTSPSAAAAGSDSQLRASIVRKYDVRIMPAAFLTYLIFYLDRSNIAIARINHLDEDLHLVGAQFNTALVVFAIPFILFNVPGNLLLRRVGAGRFLPLIILAWGVVTLASGFVKNFAGLCVTRVFLGMAESSFLGGVMLYLGFFYAHDEIIARVGVFYSATPLAGSIGGLLAGGLGQIDVNGYRGWTWIFFVEGALTILFAGMAWLLMPNTPAEAGFLTSEEKVYAVRRMDEQESWGDMGPSGGAASAASTTSDQEAAMHTSSTAATTRNNDLPVHRPHDKLEWATIRRAVLSPITIILSIGAFLSIGTIGSYGSFLPTLIRAMGFRQLQATLMTVPPNVVAFLFVLAMTQWSQRRHITGVPLLVSAVFGALGFLLLLVGAHVGPGGRPLVALQYTGTFLVGMGVSANPPLALSWISINASPYYVRAVTIGFVIGVGSFASFVSAYTYIESAAPWYDAGHSINLAFLVTLIIITLVVIHYINWENAKRARGERDYRLDASRLGGMDRAQYELQLGWDHPRYRLRI